MNNKRLDLIQRVADTHDTWFVEEAAPPGGGRRYRLLAKEKGEPLFPQFMTSDQVHAFLDGYAVGLREPRRDARFE